MVPDRSTRSLWLAGLVVALLTAVTFLPSLAGEFLWDDNILVREQAATATSLTSGMTGGLFEDRYSHYYRPVMKVLLRLQYLAFGSEPRGYRAVALVLHALCALLGFLWISTRLGRREGSLVAAAVGALVFGVHPTRPESVAWISGTSDLWMSLFVIAGFLLWLRGSRFATSAAVVLFGLGLLTKESAIAVPLLLALDGLLDDQVRDRAWRKKWVAVVGIYAALLVLHAIVVPPPASLWVDALQQPLGRIAASLGHYLSALLWPAASSMLIGVQHVDHAGRIVYDSSMVALGAAGWMAVAALAVLAWRKPSSRQWIRDGLWFLVALLPVLNLIPLGLRPLVAERFLYLPFLGLSSLFARFAVAGLRGPSWQKLSVVLMASAVIATLANLTLVRLDELTDDGSLWAREHELHPDNTLAIEVAVAERFAAGDSANGYRLLARGYLLAVRQHEGRQARRFVLRAAEIRLVSLSDAEEPDLSAMADFYERVWAGERTELTIPVLGTVVLSKDQALAGGNADTEEHLAFPRAVALARVGRHRDAEAALRDIVRAHPRLQEAWTMLILVILRQERFDEARGVVEAGMRVVPDPKKLGHHRGRVAHVEMLFATGRPIDRAEGYLNLRSPGMARATIDAAVAAHPEDVALWLERMRVDLADQRPDLAREALGRARAALPSDASRWTKMENDIREFERLASYVSGAPAARP